MMDKEERAKRMKKMDYYVEWKIDVNGHTLEVLLGGLVGPFHEQLGIKKSALTREWDEMNQAIVKLYVGGVLSDEESLRAQCGLFEVIVAGVREIYAERFKGEG